MSSFAKGCGDLLAADILHRTSGDHEMSRRRWVLLLRVFLLLGVMAGLLPIPAVSQELSDDEAQAKQIAERFATVLEKNPRRGTAFDKVYGYHVEMGTLDDFVRKYLPQGLETRATTATPFLIAGLVESRRGKDTEAVRLFQKAESLDPNSVMASYYLGQALVDTGQTTEAAEAFERAIERQPAPADVLDVFQSLGRLYQRTQNSAKALAVWQRLEKLFPNDLKVQEQIATALLEENDLVAALPRFESLAKATRDKSRQTLLLLEVADLKVRLKKDEEGLLDFERLLGQLNPHDWLFRETRRRLEAVYLRSNDQTGLIKHYELWIGTHPEDLDAVARLSRLLAGQGRMQDSRRWLKQGLKLAPSHLDLRNELIGQLIADRQFDEAAEQFQELNKHDSNNPDTLREWGRVLLRSPSGTREENERNAVAVWKRLIEVRPNDAHMASQVADLCRRADISEPAIEYYRKAIELAPDSGQYREYLGEYLHSLKRKEEAIDTWRGIAADPRKSAENLARLAEVLARFGELNEAITINAEACRMDARDLNLQLKQADLQTRAERYADALRQLAIVEKLVANDEERERWMQRELTVLKASERLKARIVEVQAEMESSADKRADANRWYWLAKAFEADNRPREATEAILKATELAPKSIAILTVAAQLNETQRRLQVAVGLYTQLATLNRRSRTEYLRRIAALEEKSGHTELALKAGREMLDAAPGSPDASDFVAGLCFRLNRHDEGIQILRRSLRTNPGDTNLLMKLAAVLVDRGQLAEAVELLWRAFERARETQDKLAIIEPLTVAHTRAGKAILLMERLERECRENPDSRDMTLCLARALEVVGNVNGARAKLESLLAGDSRDADLLMQLSAMAERQRDYKAAVQYQRRLWKESGNKQDRYRLASLMILADLSDEAINLLVTDGESHELTPSVLKFLDAMINRSRIKEARASLQQLMKRFPDNWELLYRDGVVQAQSQAGDAAERFEALLKLDLAEDSPSLLGPLMSSNLTTRQLPLLDRVYSVSQVQRQVQLLAIANAMPRGAVQRAQQQPLAWNPRDYGSARMAAWCWLVSLRGDIGSANPINFSKYPGLENPTTRRQLIDRISVVTAANRGLEKFQAALELARFSPEDIEAQALCLWALPSRAARVTTVVNGQTRVVVQNTTQLDGDTLDLLIHYFEAIGNRPDLSPLHLTLLSGLITELRNSGKETAAQQVLSGVIARATGTDELAMLIGISQLLDLSTTNRLLDRVIELQDRPAPPVPTRLGTVSLTNLSSERFPAILLPILQKSNEQAEMSRFNERMLRVLAHDWSNRPAPDLIEFIGKPRAATRFNSSTTTKLFTQGLPAPANPGQTLSTVRTTQPAAVAAARRNVRSNDMPGVVFRVEAVSALEVIRRHFEFKKEGDQLLAEWEAMRTAKGVSTVEHLFWQHAIAYLQWMNGQRDDALKRLASEARNWPNHPELTLGLALQYKIAERPVEALAALDSIERYQPSFDQYERIALAMQLALDANLRERARIEADALVDSPVPTEDVLELANRLLQHGFHENVVKLLDNVPNSSQVLQMQMLRMEALAGAGRKDEAVTVAIQVLDLVVPRGQSNPKASNAEVMTSYQNRCLLVLHQAGQLQGLIDEAEKNLLKTPASVPLMNRLVAYHTTAGNKTRIDELAIHKLKMEGDQPPNRYSLAMKYLEQNDLKEAREQFQRLLERDPKFFGTRCRDILLRNDGSKLPLAFIAIITELDWGAKPEALYELPAIIDELRSRASTAPDADKLFVKLWKSRPDVRQDLLEQFKDPRWWRLEAVLADLNSIVIPRSAEAVKDQWKCFGRLYRISDADLLVTVWNTALDEAASRNQLDGLAKDIAAGMQTYPDWRAGPVLLAMVDLRRGRVDAGRKSLEELLPALDRPHEENPLMAWEIGQELARHPENLDAAVKFYTVAMSTRRIGRTDWISATSPARALVDTYLKYGRRDAARKVLWDNIPADLRIDANDGKVPLGTDVAQLNSICRKMRLIGLGMEAIEIYLGALQRTEGQVLGGYEPRTELLGSLAVAYGEQKEADLIRYLTEFRGPGRHLYLPLLFRRDDPDPGRMMSRWDSLLTGIAQDPELRDVTEKELQRISHDSPESLSALILLAQIHTLSGDTPKATESAKRLAKWIADRPLSKRANNESETLSAQESDQMALWMIARQCLTQPEQAEIGKALGERALTVSRHEATRQGQFSILTEWLRMARKAGDKLTEDRLNQELDTITME
jgi:tetratricopeptide (TPR) repeat protein